MLAGQQRGRGVWSVPAGGAAANGPCYATPSWDQKLPASTRFVVLTDWNSEAVLDRDTGLVWEQSPAATALNWKDSWAHCRTSTKGNRKGWRLPSQTELQTLVDPTTSQPALPSGHPFTGLLIDQQLSPAFTTHSYYRSSTADDSDTTLAFSTNFTHGDSENTFDKTSSSPDIGVTVHAWCVRGQDSAERQ